MTAGLWLFDADGEPRFEELKPPEKPLIQAERVYIYEDIAALCNICQIPMPLNDKLCPECAEALNEMRRDAGLGEIDDAHDPGIPVPGQ